MDDGHDIDTTNRLIDTVNTLRDTIQAQNDYEEQEAARKYMAKRNLEAETPTKSFCSQIRKSKERVKLTNLIKERKLTQAEQLADPTQKQFVEIFVKDFYSSLYAKKTTNPNSEEILNAVGKDNIKTLNP